MFRATLLGTPVVLLPYRATLTWHRQRRTVASGSVIHFVYILSSFSTISAPPTTANGVLYGCTPTPLAADDTAAVWAFCHLFLLVFPFVFFLRRNLRSRPRWRRYRIRFTVSHVTNEYRFFKFSSFHILDAAAGARASVRRPHDSPKYNFETWVFTVNIARKSDN